MKKYTIYDIETGPQAAAAEELVQAIPNFDPSTVKMGNLKDEAKREAKLEQAALDYDIKRVEMERKAYKDCCLDGSLGHVVAIGIQTIGGDPYILDGLELGEAGLLEKFWGLAEQHTMNYGHMYGWNTEAFDLPFLLQRSWCLGVPVPHGTIERYRFYSPVYVDLMKVYTCGTYGKFCKLSKAAKAMGVQVDRSAAGEVDGASFWRAWQSKDPEQMAQARAYLLGDIQETAAVACKLMDLETLAALEKERHAGSTSFGEDAEDDAL